MPARAYTLFVSLSRTVRFAAATASSALRMHRTHLRELLRDADIAYAIGPAIQSRKLTFAETRDALIALAVPRAAGIAGVVTSNYAQPAHPLS